MCRLALVIHGLRQLSAGGRLREDDYTRLDWVDLLVVTSRGTSTRPRETARWIAVLLEPLVVRLRLPSVARVGTKGSGDDASTCWTTVSEVAFPPDATLSG